MSKKDKNAESPKPEKAAGKSSSPSTLPVLFDFSLSISKLIIILIGVVTLAISVASGATLLDAAIRGGLAILSIGIILWLINWIMIKESLEGVLVKVNKLKSKTTDSSSGANTFEKNV